MATSGDLNKAMQDAIKRPREFFNALRRRDFNEAAIWAGKLPRNYQGIARQMLQDMAGLGALRPGTVTRARNVGRGKGLWDSRRNDELLGRYARDSWRGSMGGLPQVTGEGEDRVITPFMRPEGMSLQDFATSSALSRLTQFMDPQSKELTRQYLARENPELYGGYNFITNSPASAGVQDRVDPQQLAANLAEAQQVITPEALTGGTYGKTKEELLTSGGETFSPTEWLRNYFNTASQGVGGTRRQQQFAAERLRTLENEAKESPQLQNIRTFAEDLINPVAQRASLSNIIGQKRTLNNRRDEYRRGGVALRNPTAT